jgi:Hypothetical protein (DUF2513)
LKRKSKTQLRKERQARRKNRVIVKSTRLTTCPHCGCRVSVRRAKKHLQRCPEYLHQYGNVLAAHSIKTNETALKLPQLEPNSSKPLVVAGDVKKNRRPNTIEINLVRRLLLQFSRDDIGESTDMPIVDSYDNLDVRLHVILLHDAGYIRCAEISNNGKLIYAMPCSLTPRGKRVSRRIQKDEAWARIIAPIQHEGHQLSSIGELQELLSPRLLKD